MILVLGLIIFVGGNPLLTEFKYDWMSGLEYPEKQALVSGFLMGAFATAQAIENNEEIDFDVNDYVPHGVPVEDVIHILRGMEGFQTPLYQLMYEMAMRHKEFIDADQRKREEDSRLEDPPQIEHDSI